jgi:hypothetical protein
LSDVVGRRALVANIHVWSGVALPVPIVISLLGPWGARMRRDLRRINVWTNDEVRGCACWARNAPRVVDKFNPGQKLNAIFVGGSIVVMLATGFILKWFRFFPVSWRTGATFVHDVLAFAIFAVVIGHILFALDPSRFAALDDQRLGERIMGRPECSWVVAGGEGKTRTRPAALTLDAESMCLFEPVLLPVRGLGGPERPGQMPLGTPGAPSCRTGPRLVPEGQVLDGCFRVDVDEGLDQSEGGDAHRPSAPPSPRPVRSTISVTALISILCTSTTSTVTRRCGWDDRAG